MDDLFSGTLDDDERRLVAALPAPPPIGDIATSGAWIIEWRGEEEARTGTRLRLWLDIKQKGWGRLVSCASRNDVVSAIKAATYSATSAGAQPILQIEASITAEGIGGPGPDGRRELLSWQDVSAQLQRLNLATRCQLLLVCPRADGVAERLAACSGERLPCVAVIGPDGEVDEDLRLQALTTLYRNWIKQRPGIEAASRELAPARMRIDSMVALAHERWISGLVRATRAVTAEDLAQQLDAYAAALGPAFERDVRSDPRMRLMILPRKLHKAWRSLLMVDVYPENRRRYDFDAKAAAWGVLQARGLA